MFTVRSEIINTAVQELRDDIARLIEELPLNALNTNEARQIMLDINSSIEFLESSTGS
jgi:hypothetical protein